MATVSIGPSRYNLASPEEVRAIIREELGERERARTIKDMRLPQISGTAASSAITLGKGIAAVGPESGYKWSLRRITVNGMTTGATPDVLNMYVNDTGSQPLWQFNGNNFAYTWGRREMVLNPGEILLFASVGTFAATGQITVSGQLDEVAADMFGKYA